MGSSGAYTKKTAVTGTQKKILKGGYQEFKRGLPYRQAAEKQFVQQMRGEDKLSRQLQQEAQAISREYGPGGKAYSPEVYAKALQNAQAAFAPLQSEAMRNFQQQVLPEIMNQFGRGSRTSSALNQALGAAATNLQSQLSANIGQLAVNDLARNQAMQFQARQLPYQTYGNLYSGQQNAAGQLFSTGIPGAQIGLSKDQFAFAPRSTPFMQDVALSLIGAGGQYAASKAAAGSGGAQAAPAAAAVV